MPVAVATFAALLITKVIDFLKMLTNQAWSSAATQLSSWVAGVFVVVLVAHTSFGVSLAIAGVTLHSLNGWTQVLLGLMVASGGSITSDAIGAVAKNATPIAMRSLAPPTPLPQAVPAPQVPTSVQVPPPVA